MIDIISIVTHYSLMHGRYDSLQQSGQTTHKDCSFSTIHSRCQTASKPRPKISKTFLSMAIWQHLVIEWLLSLPNKHFKESSDKSDRHTAKSGSLHVYSTYRQCFEVCKIIFSSQGNCCCKSGTWLVNSPISATDKVNQGNRGLVGDTLAGMEVGVGGDER